MNDETTRPATFDDVKQLIRSLNETGVKYLLIGGYALFAHGYHRATEDVDIMIPANKESGELIKQALLKLPDKAAEEINVTWVEEGETIRVADEFIVDILMNASGETYETLEKYKEVIEVDGIPLCTLNLEGLIKTKQTVREKDKQDCIILEKALEQLKQNK